MPYGLPSVHTADEKQSCSWVGSTRLFTASAMATAVDAAGDLSIRLAISPPAAQALRLRHLLKGTVTESITFCLGSKILK